MFAIKLQKEIKKILGKKPYEYNVKTNKNYHGVKVDIYAYNKKTKKSIFMYVKETLDDPLSVINLYNIRDLNKETLNNPNCMYVLLSEKKPGLIVDDLSKANNIQMVHNTKELKQIISK